MIRKVRWDPAKAEANFKKHGVRFVEAETIFNDLTTTSVPDVDHSIDEDRYRAVGRSERGYFMVVIYTIRDDEAWLITARNALPAERRRFMKGELRDKPTESINTDDLPETDFTNGIVGLHYIPNTVVTTVGLYQDVAEYFPNQQAVNRALREVMAIGQAPSQRGY